MKIVIESQIKGLLLVNGMYVYMCMYPQENKTLEDC